MHDYLAVTTSLISLTFACALLACSVVPRPDSWLRGDTLAMIFISQLTGWFALGLAANSLNLWTMVETWGGGVSLGDIGLELLGVAALAATTVIAVALVRAAARDAHRSRDESTPPAPNPTPRPADNSMKKAA